jgi:hypothetical protein
MRSAVSFHEVDAPAAAPVAIEESDRMGAAGVVRSVQAPPARNNVEQPIAVEITGGTLVHQPCMSARPRIDVLPLPEACTGSTVARWQEG